MIFTCCSSKVLPGSSWSRQVSRLGNTGCLCRGEWPLSIHKFLACTCWRFYESLKAITKWGRRGTFQGPHPAPSLLPCVGGHGALSEQTVSPHCLGWQHMAFQMCLVSRFELVSSFYLPAGPHHSASSACLSDGPNAVPVCSEYCSCSTSNIVMLDPELPTSPMTCCHGNMVGFQPCWVPDLHQWISPCSAAPSGNQVLPRHRL